MEVQRRQILIHQIQFFWVSRKTWYHPRYSVTQYLLGDFYQHKIVVSQEMFVFQEGMSTFLQDSLRESIAIEE